MWKRGFARELLRAPDFLERGEVRLNTAWRDRFQTWSLVSRPFIILAERDNLLELFFVWNWQPALFVKTDRPFPDRFFGEPGDVGGDFRVGEFRRHGVSWAGGLHAYRI